MSPHTDHPARRVRRRGFSIIELLVALVISSTLLAAAMVALDVMFKRYTVISDTASTHVVARTVMHRILSMIRTGTQFGPFPADVFDAAQNPKTYDSIQFVSFDDGTTREITEIVKRASGIYNDGTITVEHRGPFTLWMVVTRSTSGGTPVVTERPLLDGVLDAKFTLRYDVGPRLTRATVDMTIQPQGNAYSRFDASTGMWTSRIYDNATKQWLDRRMVAVDETSPTIRLIASTGPRTDF